MSDRPLVMVVDDDKLNTVIASELLEKFGIECVPASSGEEALRLIQYFTEKKKDGDRPAFILMDHVMPGMDGIETARRIGQLCDIPLYGVSGGFTDQIREKFMAVGAKELITKPIKPEVIYEVICRTLPEGSFKVPKKLLHFHSDEESDQKNGESRLKNCLKGVQGINYDRGLKNAFGQETTYRRNLSDAASEMETYCGILENYVNDSDTVKLKIAAHSLKTVFSIIGIKFMYHESEVVESAADRMINAEQESTPTILFYEHVNAYKNSIRQISSDLRRALEEYSRISLISEDSLEASEALEPLDARDMAQAIAYTLTALERFEYDYVMEGLEILRKAYTDEPRARVEKAIESVRRFDYDTAKDIVNDLSVLVSK